jgi:uncharacterized protein
MQQLFEYWARNRDISLNVVDQMIRKLVYRRPRTHMCNAGLRVIGITIDGDIYPCHDFAGRYSQDSDRRNALLIGNVRTGYAAGKKGFGEFRIGPEIRSGAGFDCGTCWARWACSRGCPYMNYTVSGDLRTVNPNYCATTRIGASVALRWISALDDCGLTPPKFGRGRAGSPAVVQVQSDKSPFVSQGAAEHVAPGATA